MLVIYEGRNEILVCVKDQEAQMLKDYFIDALGRDVGDYDRSESNEVVRIRTAVRID